MLQGETPPLQKKKHLSVSGILRLLLMSNVHLVTVHHHLNLVNINTLNEA